MLQLIRSSGACGNAALDYVYDGEAVEELDVVALAAFSTQIGRLIGCQTR